MGELIQRKQMEVEFCKHNNDEMFDGDEFYQEAYDANGKVYRIYFNTFKLEHNEETDLVEMINIPLDEIDYTQAYKCVYVGTINDAGKVEYI